MPGWQRLSPSNGPENVRRAMQIAEREFRIPMVLEPEHFASPHLDELSGMTYLSYFMKEEDGPGYYSTLNWVKNQIPNFRINNFRVRHFMISSPLPMSQHHTILMTVSPSSLECSMMSVAVMSCQHDANSFDSQISCVSAMLYLDHHGVNGLCLYIMHINVSCLDVKCLLS